MKTKIFLLISILVFASSCKKTTNKDEFIIKGHLPNEKYDGQRVFLQEVNSDNTMHDMDSTSISKGIFEFKGTASQPALRFISFENEQTGIANRVLLVVEPGIISIEFDSITAIKGTPINDGYQEFTDKKNILNNEMKDLFVKAEGESDPKLKKDIEAKIEDLDKRRSTLVFDYVKANINNPLGEYIFVSSSYIFDASQLKELLSLLSPEFKTNKRVQKIEKRVTALESTSIGKNFTDVKGKSPQGKDVALSDYVGKSEYVLVDFWASWCPPCREEMPKLVEIYKNYHKKGFEIVGISLDKTNEAWEKGIKDLGITWPQISDLKYWDSEPAAAYGVSSIPYMILIDKEGKILERGIDADKLSEKLSELLK